MAAVSLPTGLIVAGIPLAIVAVNLVSDLVQRRAWNRDRWLLGHDFALAALALALLNCLLWFRQYLRTVQEAAGLAPTPLAPLLEPAGDTLILVLAVVGFAALVVVTMRRLLPARPRDAATALPLSYARIALINAVGLLPLLVASLLFAELD